MRSVGFAVLIPLLLFPRDAPAYVL